MAVNSDTSSEAWSDTVPELEEYSPSVKLVARVLDLHGELSRQAIIDETFLPPRTVRYAVKNLREDGLISARYCPTDARMRFYELSLDSRMTESGGLDVDPAVVECE